jgi:general secretion pathway protein H
MISPAEPARGRPAGFTLIELIVVIAVLGLTFGVLIARGPLSSRTLTARNAVDALAGGLRQARAQAIATNRPVEFDVDIAQKSFHIDKAAPVALPADYQLSLVTTAGERRGVTDGAIRFEPDGSSTGGRIDLVAGKRRVKIGIDWLSGRVSVADAP